MPDMDLCPLGSVDVVPVCTTLQKVECVLMKVY